LGFAIARQRRVGNVGLKAKSSVWSKRHGEPNTGLACIMAVAWDTQFSPVDIRTLLGRHRAFVGGRPIFDRQIDGRVKTAAQR
jgi:hypothetical protein